MVWRLEFSKKVVESTSLIQGFGVHFRQFKKWPKMRIWSTFACLFAL